LCFSFCLLTDFSCFSCFSCKLAWARKMLDSRTQKWHCPHFRFSAIPSSSNPEFVSWSSQNYDIQQVYPVDVEQVLVVLLLQK
jgi:hypothetical protein